MCQGPRKHTISHSKKRSSMNPGNHGGLFTFPRFTSKASSLGASLLSDGEDGDYDMKVVVETREGALLRVKRPSNLNRRHRKKRSKFQQAYTQQNQFIYQRPIQFWICIFQKEARADRDHTRLPNLWEWNDALQNPHNIQVLGEKQMLYQKKLANDPTYRYLYAYIYIYNDKNQLAWRS